MTEVDKQLKSIESSIELCSISRRKKNLLYAKINKLCIIAFQQIIESLKEKNNDR